MSHGGWWRVQIHNVIVASYERHDISKHRHLRCLFKYLVRAHSQENNKAPHHWLFARRIRRVQWITLTKISNSESVSMSVMISWMGAGGKSLFCTDVSHFHNIYFMITESGSPSPELWVVNCLHKFLHIIVDHAKPEFFARGGMFSASVLKITQCKLLPVP